MIHYSLCIITSQCFIQNKIIVNLITQVINRISIITI